MLDVRSDTLALLFQNKILGFKDEKRPNRFVKRFVPVVEIENFKALYVSVRQIVNSSGLDRNLVVARLNKLKIADAFPGKELKTKFVLRSDLGRLLEDVSVS